MRQQGSPAIGAADDGLDCGAVTSGAFEPGAWIEASADDCNANGIPDRIDVFVGNSEDLDLNGIPDECECVGDIDGDGVTGHSDLGILLPLLGTCEGIDPEYDPHADLNCDGCVEQGDLGILLGDWGCGT